MPVLQAPPAAGLPWPPGRSLPRLAPPRTVRPAADAWLCSATLFLAAGEGGRSSSSALAAGLGWGAPLAGSVLAQQLLQLGGCDAAYSVCVWVTLMISEGSGGGGLQRLVQRRGGGEGRGVRWG